MAKKKRKKKKTKDTLEPKPSYEVFLEYTEYRTGGEAEDPEDRWTSHADEHVDFQPTAITKLPPSSWIKETIPVDFEPEVGQDVTMVVVRYETGSTFGRIIGVWQMIGVFKDHQRALKIRNIIDEYSRDDPDYFSKKKKSFEETLNEQLANPVYPNWFGYFERYIRTELHCMTIR